MRSMLRSNKASKDKGNKDKDKDTDTDTDDDTDTDTDTDTDIDDDTDTVTKSLVRDKRGWKSLKWRSYWIYIYARHIIQYHKEWSEIYYNFCMKFLRGQEAPLPQRIVALYGTTYAYDAFFARAYKQRHFDAEKIKYAEEVARDILRAAKEMVRANTWVSESTRDEALRKLDTLKITIGIPQKLGPDISSSISARFKKQDAWENLMDIFKWKTQLMIRNDGRAEYDMPQIDWNQMKFIGSQAYVANAYYTETRNSVYIPLGYFQTGFVDLSHGSEYNLARIGYTLGHEIGHCLHVYGRMFDHTGNMRSWWTRRDAAIYNRKLANIERQYEAAARRDGLEFDAKLSLSEDLADITGLKLCEMALNERHQRDKMLVPLRIVSFEKFYTEFANQNRQKIYRRSIFAQLKSNPHPLDKYRTNIPLSRMALFNKLYNIKPGDHMHWQTEDTVW
jgi:putative endopeptidase